MRDWTDRFLDKISESESGCWEWTGHVKPNGYGQVRINRRPLHAHRVAYEAMRGPIPPGLVIDHLCRNRRCVRPEHLEPVSHRTNILRGEGPAARHARQTHCLRGHPFNAANTYVSPRGARNCRACRAERKRTGHDRQGVTRAPACQRRPVAADSTRHALPRVASR
ncbi:HNH endonuclease signature motif containing protein [Streptomyces parvus]|uniref:HNH endonuclease signature motif containing protein n=1 Tax=Streptomyces parvus TaxID=66428 RepID=UPI0033F8FDC2